MRSQQAGVAELDEMPEVLQESINEPALSRRWRIAHTNLPQEGRFMSVPEAYYHPTASVTNRCCLRQLSGLPGLVRRLDAVAAAELQIAPSWRRRAT